MVAKIIAKNLLFIHKPTDYLFHCNLYHCMYTHLLHVCAQFGGVWSITSTWLPWGCHLFNATSLNLFFSELSFRECPY